MSRKTSNCEKRIEQYLKPIGFEENRVLSCTTPLDLGEILCKSLTLCHICIIVGGLDHNSDENISTVLSRVFSNAGISLQNVRKLQSESGQTGYLVRYKSQAIIVFPDSPDDIETMLDNKLAEYLEKSFS
ncbi:MAG: hypothetical protein KBS62_06515 [Oscillospiraceae bacterium]|nr:hypothetical protein [Candidatus Ruminococcus equi]